LLRLQVDIYQLAQSTHVVLLQINTPSIHIVILEITVVQNTLINSFYCSVFVKLDINETIV